MFLAKARIGAAAVLIAALGACGTGDPSARGIQKIHADDRLPSETLQDWASYADHVVIATVTAEKETRESGDVNAAGEGIIGRTLTMRVDKSVWSRGGAPKLAGSFPMAHDGWLVRNGSEKSEYMTGDTRLVVGAAYLLAMTAFPDGWGTVGSTSFGDVDAAGALKDKDWGNPALASFKQKRAEDVAGVMRNTRPDAIAAKHFDKGPVARYAAVIQEKGE